MRLVCVGCFVKQSRKRSHITVKKTNHPCSWRGCFFEHFSLAWLCGWCLVCFLKQTRHKCHITVKATHRLLQFALVVCSLLCKAIMKKAPFYCKEDKSSMLMEGFFSRTFFLLAGFAIGV